jgi:hypothetical protein
MSEARTYFAEIVELGNIGDDEPFDSLPEAERLRRGAQLADHWEAIADECQRSKATRFLFNQWTPQQMRAEAAIWREGRDPRWT